MGKKIENDFKQEIIRKGIHLCSLSIPIGYALLGKSVSLSVLIPIAIFAFAIDMGMKFSSSLRKLVLKIFGKIMRPHELKNEIVLNGATWVFISACVCIILLPKLFAIIGFSILIISDTAAALYGKKYGKHKWFVNKSVEGSLAFAATAILNLFFIGFLVSAQWQFYAIGALCCVIGSLVEAVSGILKIDDNLSIPLSIGYLLWLGSYISEITLNYSFTNLI